MKDTTYANIVNTLLVFIALAQLVFVIPSIRGPILWASIASVIVIIISIYLLMKVFKYKDMFIRLTSDEFKIREYIEEYGEDNRTFFTRWLTDSELDDVIYNTKRRYIAYDISMISDKPSNTFRYKLSFKDASYPNTFFYHTCISDDEFQDINNKHLNTGVKLLGHDTCITKDGLTVHCGTWSDK